MKDDKLSTKENSFLFLTLKIFPRGRHVGHNVGDEPQDGGERQQAQQQLKYHKQVLWLGLGFRQVPNGRHGQHGPVERHEVSHDWVTLDRVPELGPGGLRAEAGLVVDQVEEAGVPVERQEQVVDQGDEPGDGDHAMLMAKKRP